VRVRRKSNWVQRRGGGGVSIIWYDDEKVNGGRAEEGGQAGQVRVWMQAH
jgi:hypothetical protein